MTAKTHHTIAVIDHNSVNIHSKDNDGSVGNHATAITPLEKPNNAKYSIGIISADNLLLDGFLTRLGNYRLRVYCQISLTGIHKMETTIDQSPFAEIINSIGEDLSRQGLKETPKRAARAFYDLTAGYRQNIEQVVGNGLFDCDTSEMIVVKDIEFYSLCEHHLLPFLGKCHIAYLPYGKIIGLSKLPRIVDMFARRLQVQEELTMQIAQSIVDITGGQGAGVIMEAQHMCMMMRGVQKQNSSMTTSAMLGAFRSNLSTRNEFLTLVKN